jgi:pteridine reductase
LGCCIVLQEKIMHKTVLITGAARRIGKAIANHLAMKGWNVAIHFNNSADDAGKLADTLRESFPEQIFEIFGADLMKNGPTEELIPRVSAQMGPVSMLINNASVFEPNPLKDTTTEFLDRHMTVNFTAPFILIRDFAKQCSDGIIVNLIDTRITVSKSDFAAYTLAKKALWELTRMAAWEFGPTIRVNAIAPGLTLAPAEKDDSYLLNLARHIPMKRPGGVEPILKSLDYILENDYLTGQLLYCDGGENLGYT